VTETTLSPAATAPFRDEMLRFLRRREPRDGGDIERPFRRRPRVRSPLVPTDVHIEIGDE